MTLVEAIKTSKIDRITLGNRWLYWGSGPQYGDEIEHWVVRESRRGRRSPVVLIVTPDEEKAVHCLITGESEER